MAFCDDECAVERGSEISTDSNQRIRINSFETHRQRVIVTEEEHITLLNSFLISFLELVAREANLFLFLEDYGESVELKSREVAYLLVEANSLDLRRLLAFLVLLPNDLKP